MDDKDVKEAALKQAQEAYGMFLSFMKWVAYIFYYSGYNFGFLQFLRRSIRQQTSTRSYF